MIRGMVGSNSLHRDRGHRAGAALLGLLVLALSPAVTSAPLPQFDERVHLGVGACQYCHGAPAPHPRSSVQQDEVTIWKKRDKHSQAYEVLLEERSRDMARKLALPVPAHESPRCLSCHADYVPERYRGGKFYRLEDGVGCEACHGGAEKWSGTHYSGNTHEESLAQGLYPAEEPLARAELCLSCHFGTSDENKFVDHRLMGAGHPRMFFELDTFSEGSWKHFRVDEDYRERKPNARNGAPLWATGQVLQAGMFLDALRDPKLHAGTGLFPELVFFDCHACHHPMSDRRWEPRETTGLGPGVVRLNDSSLLMLEPIAARVQPDVAPLVRERVRELHAATTRSMDQVREAAGRLAELTRELASRALAHPYSAEDLHAIVEAIASQGASGEYRDRAAAEQSYMALQSLLDTLAGQGALAAEDPAVQRLRNICGVLHEEDSYEPEAFRAAMRALSSPSNAAAGSEQGGTLPAGCRTLLSRG